MTGKFRNFSRIASIMIVFTLVAALFSSFSASWAAGSKTSQSTTQSFSNSGNNLFRSAASTTRLLQSETPRFDPALLRQLKASARGAVSLNTRKGAGVASFVRVSKDGDLFPAAISKAAKDKSKGFLVEYGGLFGLRNVDSELIEGASSTDRFGASHLAYRQVYNNVPVFATELRIHLDAAGNLSAANGVIIPDLNVNTVPEINAAQAGELALAEIQKHSSTKFDEDGLSTAQPAASLTIDQSTLFVYQDGLIQNLPGANLLVYQVVVSGANLREFVFVDAHSGRIVNRYSSIPDALFRRLYESNTSNQVWQEGDPFPGALNGDQQNIVNFSGNSYYFFFNAFGRDSYDGAGAEMQSVNNDPTIACPNANWNGLTTNYCNGVTADDIVAHEWGHAYTEYTDNLIYQWQPGALNESYSDIWGETVDILNGVGTDAPAPARSSEVCSVFTTPLPKLQINTPASIAGTYAAGAASFGPPLTPAGISGDVVLADDGAGVTSDACTALVNGGDIAGKLALVDRGVCSFTIKVKNAQNAGAIGVIVADNVAGPVAGMGGADATITIASLRVTLATGNLIRSELASPVNATLTLAGSAPPEGSYRWLMGEDSSAFGGAIRDMWSPTCLSDPGKVTDAEYFCSTSDGGGVHTNSGVPNHGYSLLVDGGTFNGQTINPIGLVKAAHIYWRAQSVYQTPSSGFAEHADSLEAACSDLIGAPLEGLSTSGVPAGASGQTITAADCAEVSKMAAAVELRVDPSVQCNFQPVLVANPPAICASGRASPIFREDFEKGLGKWTLTNQGVFSGWLGLNWERSKNLPGGRKGPAAFAADPNAGNCDLNGGDISGMMSMESPKIKIPSGKALTPRMSFIHYIASETAWDGGNLKISVNNGAYALVPSTAYTFNPYNLTLNPDFAGNTNPLAGQPAFSGTDGGKVTGSWGQSQIDLAALGIKPGDVIRLRFEFGIDGCSGIDGWYVDDIEVVACRAK